MGKKVKKKAEIIEENDDLLGDVPEAPAPANKAPEAPKGSFLGKEVHIKQKDGAEFFGKCTCERDTPSGKQVYLQLNGLVSRFFSAADIIKK